MKILPFLSLVAIGVATTPAEGREIHQIADISVQSTEGTVPNLPWQVWVTYDDGHGEWRQVRWDHTDRQSERALSDPHRHPAGSHYQIQGYIVGDNRTVWGYPVQAEVEVVPMAIQVPDPTPTAHPLPLADVTITGQNLLTNNRDLDLRNLLSLDITQQLYNYRDTYGLPTEGYRVADGWDSPGTKLKGHGSGHYMSALAFAFASTQDPQLKETAYLKIERMVRQLRQCQERTFVYDEALGRYREARDYVPEEEMPALKGSWSDMNSYKADYQKYGYGYLNAIPAAHCVLIEKYAPYNNEEGVWAPYYAVHKQLAGLIDIANVMRASHCQPIAVGEGHLSMAQLADMALLIAKDMGLWVWNRMHYRTYVLQEGTREERRRRPGNRSEMWNMYIAGEVGGMAESLSRLSEMVADPTEKSRLLEAANCFDAPILFDHIAANVDDVRTRHANQHIPMFVGALRSYRSNGNPYYYRLASNFWEMMQGRYLYAMGGVGNGEMWREPYTQISAMNASASPDLNETCCAYNLAKLTKDLNCYQPDDARYMDYYERVLYNQIAGSVHPTDYGVCYQYAVGLNAQKPYGSPTPQESCCGGTGAENHLKYQEAAYFVSDSTLWISLYLPSDAYWREKNIGIHQACEWPAESSKIRFAVQKDSDRTFAVKLRIPYWATGGAEVMLNGKRVAKECSPCSYVEIARRRWSSKDLIEISLPYAPHIYYGMEKMDLAYQTGEGSGIRPFAPQWTGTLMYGPLVMASTDIHTWQEAEVSLSSTLDNVTVEHLEGMVPYRMSVGAHSFIPDCYVTTRSTHYLRLDLQDAHPSGTFMVDTLQLKSLLDEAQQRQSTQENWQKNPAGQVPWAPNGYVRMVEAMNRASAGAMQDPTLISALKVAILTMRPGNLAEPEDLASLFAWLEKADASQPASPALQSAVRYARMVIRYVNDGSGTLDMIRKAEEQLKVIVNTQTDHLQ